MSDNEKQPSLDDNQVTGDDNYDLLWIIVLTVIQTIVMAKASTSCYGCEIDHPSQKQHMCGGCLSPLDECTDFYFEDACGSVKAREVLQVYQDVCQELGMVEDPNAFVLFVNMMTRDDLQYRVSLDIPWSKFTDIIEKHL